MCLGIPMQIKAIDGLLARCEAKGVERDANLLMLMHEPLHVGDYIVVHLGRAIERVSPEDAATAWALYDEMLAAMDGATPENLMQENLAPKDPLPEGPPHTNAHFQTATPQHATLKKPPEPKPN